MGSCASVTVDVLGGQEPYLYTSDIVQNNNVLEDMCSGEHVIIVTDANGCAGTSTQITIPVSDTHLTLPPKRRV